MPSGPPLTPPRVVDFVVEHLAAMGISHVFGVGGANIEDLYDALQQRSGITGILAKHEFSAATMADGHSRAGAGLGVVAATSGGACLNVIAGLGESFASRVPVLAIVGQPPRALDGKGSFQDTSGTNGTIDAEAMFAPVSVYCRRLTRADDIVTALPEAIAAALRGGPAVLLIPKDIQQAAAPVDAAEPVPSPAPSQTADTRLIGHAIGRGPVTIIAGEQVARADARAELELVRAALDAPIATVPDAKDVVDTRATHAGLGVTGVMGHPGVADAVASSSVCLLIGTRLPGTAAAGLAAALAGVRTVSIGSEVPFPDSIHFHTADLRMTLTQLSSVLAETRSRRRMQPVPATELQPPTLQGSGIRYRDAMTALDDIVPAGVDIVVDAGNTGAAAIHHLPARRMGRFVVALGMGGMGYAFGAGIGMAFGRRGRVVVIAGDGAFFMHGMEIHTAVQYRLPVTFVLLNNDAHAMCVTREQLFYGGGYSYNRFEPSMLGAGLSAMFPGISAVDVDKIDLLPASLATAMTVPGPAVVCVRCSADEIPPFAPFLTAAEVTTAAPQSLSTHTQDGENAAARA